MAVLPPAAARKMERGGKGISESHSKCGEGEGQDHVGVVRGEVSL